MTIDRSRGREWIQMCREEALPQPSLRARGCEEARTLIRLQRIASRRTAPAPSAATYLITFPRFVQWSRVGSSSVSSY